MTEYCGNGSLRKKNRPLVLQFVLSQKAESKKPAAIHKARPSDFPSSTLQARLCVTILVHLQENEIT